MDQASSAFSTGVPVSAAIPQLAGNSRQGFGLVDGTMRRASGWVISSNTLGLSTSLYDGDAGSRSTGKERDTESGNDYFEARYYSSAMGRFMSPDWSAKEEPVPYAKLGDPQTLNLYSYVENGPLNRVDADGHADQVVPNSAMTPLAEC
ncbi:MAG: RHS repeat-associated core domain-containing protein, partial [Terracidiphilus sp.]